MESGKLPEPGTDERPGTRSRPLEIDLNETPLPSPRETPAAAAADETVAAAGRGGGGSGEGRGNFFERLLGSNGSERPRGGVMLLDINASPPREADGEGFVGEGRSSGGGGVPAAIADGVGDNMQTVCGISFDGRSLNAPVTNSNTLYLENGFNLLYRSVTQIRSGFEDIVQQRLGKTLNAAYLSSTLNGGIQPSHCTPLNFMTQHQSEVYLKALREYIHEKQGLLGDGWVVEFIYCKKRCKTFPVYCAPDGSRFESMSDVAGHLGLLRNYHCLETEDVSDRFGSLQKRLHPDGGRKDFLGFSRANNYRQNQNTPRSSSVVGISSGIGIMGHEFESYRSTMEAGSMENGRCGSELFQEVCPLQFEDLVVLSLGKVDPRPSYHNTSQIWPVGYRSCWHDKITGSIFVSEVVDGGDAGPSFKVKRYPCSSHTIPIGRTVLFRQKSDPNNVRDEVPNDFTATNGMDDGESLSIKMMLTEDSPPQLEDIDFQKANSLTTESSFFPKRFVNTIPDDLGLVDCIGELLVEGRSSSMVWEIASQTLLRACYEVYKQMGVLNFCCKHHVKGVNVKAADNSDSLSKFCNLSGPTNIPHLVQRDNEFETFSETMMKWLQQDRFGLDTEFVQEILEQLPGIHACTEYKFLNDRSPYSGSQTVRSGFLSVKRKRNIQDDNGTDGFLLSGKRPRKPKPFGEVFERKKSFPLGKPLSAKLPAYLIGDVLQAWEFLWRFSEVLSLEETFSFEELENELMNPWLDTTSPVEGTGNEIPSGGDFTLCTGAALRKVHSSLLTVIVRELLLKVAGFVEPNSDAGDCKSRRGRKKDADNSFASKKMKFDMLQINALTWPELARRYILVVLSMEGNLDSGESTCRESGKIFRCLRGDGGTLCGSLTGVAGMEADALFLAEASKKVFGSVKKNDFVLTDQDKSDTASTPKMIMANGDEVPEWVQALEPVRKLPTNVGARIRKCVHEALDKNPPEWAKKILEHSISKEVYKGNASGPTKRAIVSLLADVSHKDLQPKPDKKEKVKSVTTISEFIMKQCRIVLRRAVAEDEEKVFCNLLGRTLLNHNDNDDEGLLGNPAMVSRPLDFRTIDIRLAMGAYGGSHEAFLDDVREVWNNIRTAYADQSDMIDLADSLSQKFEVMYEEEVLTVVNKFNEGANSSCITDDAKREIDDMLMHANERSIPKAPWDEGVCKVCGVDRDDDNVLLCDTCDSEYHTYCLNPPLPRIPEGNWYCPSCVARQLKSKGLSHGTRVNWCQKKRYRGELTRNSMETLSRLARTMGSKEYWDFSVEERISLIKFLCDETLNTSILRDHLDHCACMSADLQQKLRLLSSEWKSLKVREENLAAIMGKENAVDNRAGELAPDVLASVLEKDCKLLGKLPSRGNNVSCLPGNFPPQEDGPQRNGQNFYSEQSYWSVLKSNSEKHYMSNSCEVLKRSDTIGQVQCQQSVKGQCPVPGSHFSLIHSGGKGANWHDELAPSLSQQQKNDTRGENAWTMLSPQQGLKDGYSNSSSLTPCQAPQGLVSSDGIRTNISEHVHRPFVQVNKEHMLDGLHSPSQSAASALQDNNLEMSSLTHEISVLQDSMAHLEYELQKVSIRKEFLGKDSDGRQYWGFNRPDTSFLIVNGSIDLPQSKGTEFGGPTGANSYFRGTSHLGMENPSSSRGPRLSGINEFLQNTCMAKSTWFSYQSQTEIGEVIGWLVDDDPREREVKESIMHWHRFRSKDSKTAENCAQNETKPSCLRLSYGGKAPDSSFLVTKAVTTLETKYGPGLGSETPDISKKRSQKGKVTCEGRMYRCECLEPIWPSRHHCISCHKTCTTTEELEKKHRDGKCSSDSVIAKNKRVNEDSLKGKRMEAESSVKKRPDNDRNGRTSKSGKSEIELNVSKFQEPECPYDFKEIRSKFVTQNSLKDLVKDVGLIACSGNPTFVPSASPCLNDPSLRLVPMRKKEVDGGNKSLDMENQPEGSIKGHNAGDMDNDSSSDIFPKYVGHDRDEEASKFERLISSATSEGNQLSAIKKKGHTDGVVNRCVIPESSLRRLAGRVSQILRQLKINLLDIDAAFPDEALRPSMAHLEKRSAWRAFVKSAGSIYEMVQATVLLENMIKADYLKKEWWYWSSLSAAASISTVSALALRIYTLDAAIIFENPSPSLDSKEIQKLVEPEGGTSPKLDTTNHNVEKSLNDPADNTKPKGRQSKRKKDSGG